MTDFAFDADEVSSLADTENDVCNEFSTALTTSFDTLRNLSSTLAKAEILDKSLRRRQFELQVASNRRGDELSKHNVLREKLKAQTRELRALRRKVTSQRDHIRKVNTEMSKAAEEVKGAQHLHCEKCDRSYISRVTICGHSYCAGCLDPVFGSGRGGCCPKCQKYILKAIEVFPLSRTPAPPRRSPEVVCLDTDDEEI